MATDTLLSATITNRDATPRVASNSRLAGAHLRSAVGYATSIAGVLTGSTYRLVSVPSNAYVRSVLLSCAALGGSTAHDVGVYRTTADGGAVVDADLFASGVSTVSALSRSDVTNESTTNTVAVREQPLWQAAGMAADPGGYLDIVLTSTATNTSGGLIGVEVNYVI